MPNVSMRSRGGSKPGSSMTRQRRTAARRPMRHVDEEDPVPARPVDEVAADGRAEQRAGDGAEAEEAAGHAVLLLGVAREEDALRGRDDRAAAEALQHAEEHQRRQVPREAAQRAGGREEQDRAGEVAAEAEAALEPPGHRDDDDVRHHVAGRDPADLIERRAEAGADVVERDVDDRDVDERHERGAHRDDVMRDLGAGDRRSPVHGRLSVRGRDADVGAHARAQRDAAAACIEADQHRHALHDLGEVARGVVGRQQREARAGAGRRSSRRGR